MNSKSSSVRIPVLALALIAAILLRFIILANKAVPFNSDEAVVALMARHTLEGTWPIFFYGQSYMGSLDATLIAGAFAVLGESVLVIRLVQTALYLGIVATTYLLGLRFFDCRWRAGASAFLIALPTVLVSTYTTATLGGYGEIVLLGNLIFLLGHAVISERPEDWRLWVLLGVAAGLGFWTLALIVVYLLPWAAAVLWMAIHERRKTLIWKGILVATVAFFLSSSPWWYHNLTHNWSALRFLITGVGSSGIGIKVLPFSMRLIGMISLGMPALLGIRFPWSASFFSLPLSVPVLMIYLAAVSYALVQAFRRRNLGRDMLLGIAVTFCLLFLYSSFGTDATGRYFLPLAPVLALLTADMLGRVHQESRLLALLAVFFLLAFNILSNGLAVHQNPPGLTTQSHPITRFDNSYDEELIQFLHKINVSYGYSSYWAVFRIAFLSNEEIILSSQLPYKADLSYNPADDRYPRYTEQVDLANKVVYITASHPTLDALLAERLEANRVGYSEKQIGPYHLFYELTSAVRPSELGFGHP